MAAEGKIDPMHQFTVEPLVPLHIGPYDVSFTNSSAWMLITLALIFGFMALGMKRELVPGRWQMAVEGLTGFIDDLVKVNIGPKGKAFVPYIFSLFSFILVSNLLGLLPLSVIPGLHAFTTTSQFSITGVLAVLSFSIVLVVGFWKHGLKFLKFFVPSGVPVVMLPLLVVIEVISYLTRPLSLSVRLFANMMAGHTMLKVFGAFVVALGLLGGWAALAFMVAFTGLEILVAFLQAYVFAILTCIYLNDALHMHP